MNAGAFLNVTENFTLTKLYTYVYIYLCIYAQLQTRGTEFQKEKGGM